MAASIKSVLKSINGTGKYTVTHLLVSLHLVLFFFFLLLLLLFPLLFPLLVLHDCIALVSPHRRIVYYQRHQTVVKR